MDRQVRQKPNDDGQLVIASHQGTKTILAKLPIEVLVKIVFSIPDAAEMLAFLELLRPYVTLGPLEYLYQLGCSMDHDDLWPTLLLCEETLETLSGTPYEAIVQYYPNLIIEFEGTEAIEWLRTHLNPRTSIEWCVNDVPAAVENVHFWANMRITKASIMIENETESMWKNLLPRLDHVVALHVAEEFGNLEDIYAYVAESKQVTEFEIYSHSGYAIRRSDVVHLIKWFRRQPVKVYESWFTNWSALDWKLRQECCEVMLNCPTLERLRLSDCYLDDMDFSRFRFSTKSLWLDAFDSDNLVSIARQLEGSGLKSLSLTDAFDDEGNFEGIKSLLTALPQSSITILSITEVDLSNKDWCKLTHLLQKCHLESLEVEIAVMTSALARSFAKAIQKNRSICEFHLCKCDIAVENLKILIRSISDVNRHVQSKQIKWTTLESKKIKDADVRSLEEFATECGCDFVHDRVLF
ncbi:unnamed protein product [Aphanomyces euteiches]